MEVCLAEDNDRIERLVTAATFDEAEAAEIARHQPWMMWGWKEYWDVLRTVWEVNRSGGAAQKLRLIGLDHWADAGSMMLLGIEGPAKGYSPWWERLRIWRLPRVATAMVLRDAAMARQVRREMLDKREKGIVLVGSEHALVHAARPPFGSMGLLLRRTCPDRVWSVRLHQMDLSMSMIVEGSQDGARRGFAALVEGSMAIRHKKPVGFDVGESPIGNVRDSASLAFQGSGEGLARMTDGYVYLCDVAELGRCTWQDGYITQAMFVRYRPLYEAVGRRAGLPASNATEVNVLFSQIK
jgi:hypothetical protein